MAGEHVTRPVHFEIHAADPERAQRFYTTVFDWKFERWGDVPYWVVTTGADGTPGINGGLVQRPGGDPIEGQAVNAWVVTVDVPDCAAYVQRGLEAGGTIALDRHAVPGLGWLAYLKDTEGNIFGLMQNDPTAT
jgi:predicted enzyme related to lactoylglutathione lyase